MAFYYSKAKSIEGLGVSRDHPLFIRDCFKLGSEFFCSSEIVIECLQGIRCFEKRSLPTEEEKLENERLNLMEELMEAEQKINTSKDFQRTSTMENDKISMEPRLNKSDTSPSPVVYQNNGDMFNIMSSTQESKAKACVAKEIKIVAKACVETIDTLNSKLDKETITNQQLQNKLDAVMAALAKENITTPGFAPIIPIHNN